MKHDSEYTLLDWLGFSRVPKYWNAPRLGPIIAVCMSIILLVTLLAGFAILIQLWFFVFNTSANDSFEPARNLSLTLAGLFGAPFVVWQVWLAQRRADNADEGLITDRINAAVASLGADKTVKGFDDGKEYTRPNIEVRVGAILALERIAKRSPDVHIQIMEILCAYIRENTKENRERPREDIQTALNVIGRRNQIQRTLEGPKTIFLSGSILNGSNMEGMDFSGAIMIGVKLNGANLNRANFKFTNLFMANLADASLMNTSFFNADLRRATFDRAVSFKTDFRKANLVGANLYLTLTLKHFPNLLRLDFSVINGEKLDCRYLTQTQINSIFSDKIAIDVSLNRPVHWPTIILADEFLEMEWKRWLQDPDGYVFDPTQYGEKYTTQTGE